MPRKGRKHPESFTLIVVPHSEKASFSVRVPFWSIYVATGLCAVGLAALGYFALDYQHTSAELAALRRDGQIGMVQQKDLRNAITAELKQQDSLRAVIAEQSEQAAQVQNERAGDADTFNAEVTRLQAQISDLEQFKADIRKIVGLDKETPVPASAPQAANTAAPGAVATKAPPVAVAATPAAPVATAPAQATPSIAVASKSGSPTVIVASSQPPAAAVAAAALAPANQASAQPTTGPDSAAAPDSRAVAGVSSRGGNPSAAAQDAIQATQALIDSSVPQQKADLESLKTEVQDRVAKVGNDWTSPTQLSQELSMYDASPRGWPAYGQIGDRFGYDARRIEIGAQPFHAGIDILAPLGTPIKAPADGVVISAGWDGTYGQELQLRHSLGWSTLYGHMQSFAVKVGDSVKKGQVIGYIGLTGLTTAPHVHYEIHLNGTPVDPAGYLGK